MRRILPLACTLFAVLVLPVSAQQTYQFNKERTPQVGWTYVWLRLAGWSLALWLTGAMPLFAQEPPPWDEGDETPPPEEAAEMIRYLGSEWAPEKLEEAIAKARPAKRVETNYLSMQIDFPDPNRVMEKKFFREVQSRYKAYAGAFGLGKEVYLAGLDYPITKEESFEAVWPQIELFITTSRESFEDRARQGDRDGELDDVAIIARSQASYRVVMLLRDTQEAFTLLPSLVRAFGLIFPQATRPYSLPLWLQEGYRNWAAAGGLRRPPGEEAYLLDDLYLYASLARVSRGDGPTLDDLLNLGLHPEAVELPVGATPFPIFDLQSYIWGIYCYLAEREASPLANLWKELDQNTRDVYAFPVVSDGSQAMAGFALRHFVRLVGSIEEVEREALEYLLQKAAEKVLSRTATQLDWVWPGAPEAVREQSQALLETGLFDPDTWTTLVGLYRDPEFPARGLWMVFGSLAHLRLVQWYSWRGRETKKTSEWESLVEKLKACGLDTDAIPGPDTMEAFALPAYAQKGPLLRAFLEKRGRDRLPSFADLLPRKRSYGAIKIKVKQAEKYRAAYVDYSIIAEIQNKSRDLIGPIRAEIWVMRNRELVGHHVPWTDEALDAGQSQTISASRTDVPASDMPRKCRIRVGYQTPWREVLFTDSGWKRLESKQ